MLSWRLRKVVSESVFASTMERSRQERRKGGAKTTSGCPRITLEFCSRTDFNPFRLSGVFQERNEFRSTELFLDSRKNSKAAAELTVHFSRSFLFEFFQQRAYTLHLFCPQQLAMQPESLQAVFASAKAMQKLQESPLNLKFSLHSLGRIDIKRSACRMAT
jgi:hypothetical protein